VTNVREVDAPPQPQPIPDVPAPEIGYEHLRTIVAAVLGLHGTAGQLDTIMTAVQAYAAGQAAAATRPDGSVIEPPGHDPHSTTSATTERRTTWDVETPATAFGFGWR
jgi:hypothetical protein